MKGGPGAHAWPTRDRPRADAAGECRVTTARPERRHAVRRRTPKDASTATATTHQRARWSRGPRGGPAPARHPAAYDCRRGYLQRAASAQRSCACRFSCPQSYQLLAPTSSWLLLFLVPPLVWLHSYRSEIYSISKHAAR